MVQIVISAVIIVYGIYYFFNYEQILKRKYERDGAEVPEWSGKTARIIGIVFIALGGVLLAWNLVRYFIL